MGAMISIRIYRENHGGKYERDNPKKDRMHRQIFMIQTSRGRDRIEATRLEETQSEHLIKSVQA
jgi:hypothetical protein